MELKNKKEEPPGEIRGCWICSCGVCIFWECRNCGFIIESEEMTSPCPASRPLHTKL